ncbi:hypothetical protein P3T24_004351 [Paraburkholderia sp. GAS33]|uniref:hypothetical protein n=1 Tax=Paraburkholderia sp. GAS33 TaxID=3035130 RepID=UPI003D197534
MTAFCVFASSMPVARERAEKQVPLIKPGTRLRYTESEWRALVEERASDIFCRMSPVQVSPAFDAPQFCDEWISLAKTTGLYEGYVTKCRGESLDKKGNPKISKTSGMPIITWVIFDERVTA